MTINTAHIVTIIDGVPTTTSLAIAEGAEIQHKNVLELIRTYLSDLSEFGGVAFETRKGQPLPQGGFAKSTEVAIINEQQTTLLFTYMRNSEIVRAFKKRLVKEFYELSHTKTHVPPKRATGALTQTKIALLFHREMVAMGVEPNLSMANVLQVTEEFTGLPAEKMRKVLTVEPANIASLNQTQLGEKAGLSSREIGKRLRDHGLMTTNERGDRMLTKEGKRYGAMIPFTKNGHSSYEPRWFESVLSVIAADEAAA